MHEIIYFVAPNRDVVLFQIIKHGREFIILKFLLKDSAFYGQIYL